MRIIACLCLVAIWCPPSEAAPAKAKAPAVSKAKADASAIDRARTLHRKATHGDDCVHCSAFGPGYDNTWPCQTIRALDGAPTKENNA